MLEHMTSKPRYNNKNFEGHEHLQPPTCNVAMYGNSTAQNP